MSTDQCDRSNRYHINQETCPMSHAYPNAPKHQLPGVPLSSNPPSAEYGSRRRAMAWHEVRAQLFDLYCSTENEHLRSIIQAQADFYSRCHELMAERALVARRASQRRALMSGAHYGPVPFGYDKLVDGQLVPNDDAMVVRWVFELRAHEASLTEIVWRLRDAKVHHPRGKQWQTHMVRSMLRRPIYAGLRDDLEEDGRMISMPGLRIVTEDLWRKVQPCR